MNAYLQQVKAKLKELAQETDAVKQSAFFKSYLDTMAVFWKYSCHNQLLIHFAKPEATRVAGFNAWKQIDRTIKKGSKAIKILAPFKKTILDEETQEEQEIMYFVPVNVFDISQTEGEPFPEIDVTLDGDEQQELLEQLIEFCKAKNINVEFKALGVNGLYGYSKGGAVVITSTESVNTQVSTLIHEIAHELLHKSGNTLSQQQKEIQAEGTAYVVAKHLGLQTKSFNYLALYDADYTKIMDNLQAIAEAVKEILEGIS